MTNGATLTWVIALIVAGTLGATFLPLPLCIACAVAAGILTARGPVR